MKWPQSPTVDLLGVFAVVFVATKLGGAVGLGVAAVALSLPLTAAPWTLVTSVYAHATVGHLLANVVALAIVGFALERFTTRARFHGYVLVVGAISGLAQVAAVSATAGSASVVGASGAILGLYGYVLAGNPLTGGVLSRLPLGRRGKLGLLAAVVVVGLTVVTASAGAALVAHAVGLALGLLAGRFHVLRPAGRSAG